MMIRSILGGRKMKFNKKSMMFGVFILGAMILITSAFVDAALGSGYQNLKNSLKTTAAKLTDDVNNFSVDLTATIKVDGKTYSEQTYNTKYDIKNQAQETRTIELQKGNHVEYYSYSDKKQYISKNFKDGSYNVEEKQKSNKDTNIIANPFEEEEVKDVEKIVDAFVGSLENVIQVEQSGKKKMYVGNIGDTEIPSLVNAISSFVFKYSILDDYTIETLNIPSPKSNITVKEASGKAVENKDGIIESGIFSVSMSAEDSKGTEHAYTLEFSMDIKGINKTIVAAPNLDGQKVTYSKQGYAFDEKYIGKYSNNIVEVKDNSFQKVGERVIEIISVKEGNVKGKYYEVYNKGYEPDIIRSFEFSSNQDELEFYTIINYTDNNGKKKKGAIDSTNLQDLHAAFDVKIDEENGGYSHTNDEENFDNEFIRVFE